VKTNRGELVFLVRMWREGDSQNEGDWRGSVQEVESGTRFYVSQTRDISDFVAARLASHDSGTPRR
jgi:hypothetical protein